MSNKSFREGDIPGASSEGGGALSEKAKEKFSENLRKAQAAQKKQDATEGKFKAYDNTLASIVKGFLNDGDKDQIVLYIAELVEQNVPTDFILAILSLIDLDADQQANLRVNDFGKKTMDIAVAFDDDISSKISSWIGLVYTCAIVDKEKVLASLIDHNSWEAIPASYLLLLEVSIVFFETVGAKYERSKQKEFSIAVINNIVNKIQEEI